MSAGWMLKPDRQVAPSESVQAVPTTSERQSIAVLPFDSLSDDPEQGYFADGLTEEILNALAGIPNLLVTARTSSFFYKNKDVPVDEIAERLGVAHILEGSVRRSGDRMRVTAQLIRAADGFHLWSQSYDRSVADAFAIQTDIVTEVATALGILLDDAQRARMEASGVRDPEAYALFARGRELYQLAHGGAPLIPTLVEANVLFDQAFARAPGLWAARGDSEALERARQQFTDPTNETSVFTLLNLTARAGDRKATNTLAAEIDARAGGPILLMNGIYFCLCGAPFDLEATPNLAARLAEAGLAWPPVESIRWPLKGW